MLLTLTIFFTISSPTGNSDARAMARFPFAETEIIEQCPPRKEYSAETGRKLGREMSDLRARDPKAVAPGVVLDYRTLRAQCDAIERK